MKLSQTIEKLQAKDSFTKEKRQELVESSNTSTPWSDDDGILKHDGKVYVPSGFGIRTDLIVNCHEDPDTGHLNSRETLRVLRRDFSWPKVESEVLEYVKNCDICQTIYEYQNNEAEPLSVPAEHQTSYRDDESKFGNLVGSLTKSKFRYEYNQLPPGHIRILILQKGEPEEDLKAKLVSMPLKGKPPPQFDALSYVWGPPPDSHRIYIEDKTVRFRNLKGQSKWRHAINARMGGARMYVRSNLNNALKKLRMSDKDIPLWIDAICINQSDNNEKNLQLLTINEVYSRAQTVRVWLGEANQLSDIGMDLVKELIVTRKVTEIFAQQEGKEKLIAFVDLIRSRWFARRWIIQEIFFAEKAHLHCGSRQPVPWKDFVTAVALFMKLHNEIPNYVRIKEIRTLNQEQWDALPAYGANALMKLDSELIRRGRGEHQLLRTLDYLVSRLVAFDAGDPRDTIFAVRNLARKTSIQLPEPSYRKSVLDVFVEFSEYCVKTSKSLDIICRHWAPVHTDIHVQMNPFRSRGVDVALPSWIRQLNKSTFGTPDNIFRGRINGDSFVGESTPNYDASKGSEGMVATFGTRAEPELIYDQPLKLKSSSRNPDQQENSCRQAQVVLTERYNGTLIVKGVLLGLVQEVSIRMVPEILPREVIALAGWKHSLSEESHGVQEVPDALWKSLIAGKDNDRTEDADIHDKLNCLEILKKEDSGGDVRIWELLRSENITSDLKSYLGRIKRVCWNRKAFIACPDKRLFGIGPNDMQKGDLLCVIYGCSVPVILRKVDKMPALGQKLRPDLPDAPRTQTSAASSSPQTQRPQNNSSERSGDIDASHPNPSNGHPSSTGVGGEGTRGPVHSQPNIPSSAQKRSKRQRSDDSSTPQKRKRTSKPSKGKFNPSSKTQETTRESDFQPPNNTAENSSPSVFYQVIGECYVDGLMDGQAIGNPDYIQNEQLFTLV